MHQTLRYEVWRGPYLEGGSNDFQEAVSRAHFLSVSNLGAQIKVVTWIPDARFPMQANELVLCRMITQQNEGKITMKSERLKGIKIATDGTWSPMFDISLEELQEAVDGYIDVMAKDDFSIFVVDDGLHLPHNKGTYVLYGVDLFGVAVVTGGVDSEGNTLPIPPKHFERILRNLPIAPDAIRMVLDNPETRDAVHKVVSQ